MCTYAHTSHDVNVRAHDWGAMRLSNAWDLGLYVREQRRRLGMTQADLCASAQVSRRWLSGLEAGKPTAEIGLVFRVLHALDVTLEVAPTKYGLDNINLDDVRLA